MTFLVCLGLLIAMGIVALYIVMGDDADDERELQIEDHQEFDPEHTLL